MRLKYLVAGLCVTALGLAPTRAQAALVTFTNLAAFQAAAGPTALETFTTATAFNTTGAFGPTAYTGFSLTGNGNGNNIGVHSAAVANAGDDTPIPAAFLGQPFFGFGNVNGGAILPLTFTFPTPITAFGFDWFNTDVTDQYTLTVDGLSFSGPPFTSVPSPYINAASGFFGVVSTTPFTTATISNQFNGGYISDEGFDNVRTSIGIAATPVPEPSTLLLVAGGALLVAIRRRFVGPVQ